MKFTASLIISCVTLFSSITSANATYRYENGMKFYIEGSENKAQDTKEQSYQRVPQQNSRNYKEQERSENPLARLVKLTFIHLVPVWGGTKCGSRWTEVLVPDAFTSPMGSVNFSQSCAIHDQCYTQQKGRKLCDREMYSNLKIECRRAFPKKNNHLRAECLNYSNIYYQTINQFGNVGYQAVKAGRQARRSYRSLQRNTHSAAQWITGRKKLRFNR